MYLWFLMHASAFEFIWNVYGFLNVVKNVNMLFYILNILNIYHCIYTEHSINRLETDLTIVCKCNGLRQIMFTFEVLFIYLF